MKNIISSDTNNPVAFEENQWVDKLPRSSASLANRPQLEESEGQFPTIANPNLLNVNPLATNKELHSGPENIPIARHQNIPIGILGQCGQGYRPDRHYIKAKQIETLAVDKYKVNGKGIIVTDLLSKGFVSNEKQARATLKYFRKKNILFTLRRWRPQKYYPACLKSEIIKRNIQEGVTGVRYSKRGLLQSKSITSPSQDLDSVIVQTLESYILPLLPKAPLHIHKMHFKAKVPSECYHEIGLPVGQWNKRKEHEEIIGSMHVKYCFYANGTVMVFTESSNNPFKLEDNHDLTNIITFFGQLRDRLVVFLNDRHERIVPGIMEWVLTQWDINKDVKVSDLFHCSSINIQVRHLTHLFRIYVKSVGKETVCRVEESRTSKGHLNAIETITTILNPYERLERKLDEIKERLIQIENK